MCLCNEAALSGAYWQARVSEDCVQTKAPSSLVQHQQDGPAARSNIHWLASTDFWERCPCQVVSEGLESSVNIYWNILVESMCVECSIWIVATTDTNSLIVNDQNHPILNKREFYHLPFCRWLSQTPNCITWDGMRQSKSPNYINKINGQRTIPTNVCACMCLWLEYKELSNTAEYETPIFGRISMPYWHGAFNLVSPRLGKLWWMYPKHFSIRQQVRRACRTSSCLFSCFSCPFSERIRPRTFMVSAITLVFSVLKELSGFRAMLRSTKLQMPTKWSMFVRQGGIMIVPILIQGWQ